MNQLIGPASLSSPFLAFFLGYLADRINYRRLVAPLFFGIFLLVLLAFLSDCMTCVWVTVLLGTSVTLVICSGYTVIWLVARNVRSVAKGTVLSAFNLSGALGLLFAGVGGPLVVEDGKGIFLMASIFALAGCLASLSVWGRRD